MFKIGKYEICVPDMKRNLDIWVRQGYYDSYRNNAHNLGAMPLTNSNNSLEDLSQHIYRFWYNFTNRNIENYKKIKNIDKRVLDCFTEVLCNPALNPKEIAKHSAYDFFVKDYKRYDLTKSILPLHAQNGTTMQELKLGGSDFIHIFDSFRDTKPINCRLYLNLKPENIVPFIDKLMLTTRHKKTPNLYMPYFKFYTNSNNRNDIFLLYTNYDNAEKYIDIFEKIKSEYPEIVEDTETISRNLASINGWIGFGEEPKFTKNSGRHRNFSYNSLREMAVEDFLYNLENNKDFESYKCENGNPKIDDALLKKLNEHLSKYDIDESFCLNFDSPLKKIDTASLDSRPTNK